MAFSPDGLTLATASWGNEVQLWEVPTGRLRQTLSGGLRPLALEFSPNGRFLAALEWLAGPRVWTSPDWAPIGPLAGHTYRVRSLAFSPDSQLLAAAGSDTNCASTGKKM